MPDLSSESQKNVAEFADILNKLTDEQVKVLKDLASIVKDTPEDEQDHGVFHVIVVKYYEAQIEMSMKFLKETNERGFPSVSKEVLARHVLPLHKFLTYQFNEMIKKSQQALKDRKK